jgi:hypothetical protein
MAVNVRRRNRTIQRMPPIIVHTWEGALAPWTLESACQRLATTHSARIEVKLEPCALQLLTH